MEILNGSLPEFSSSSTAGVSIPSNETFGGARASSNVPIEPKINLIIKDSIVADNFRKCYFTL